MTDTERARKELVHGWGWQSIYKALTRFDREQAKSQVEDLKRPKLICTCGRRVDRLIAHNTGDGWFVSWECPNYCGWAESEIPVGFWPWIRDEVWGDDWESVGVEVI
jgi:hypothetical protein